MKAVVAAFNQEKALVGAFSVITNLWMELFQALVEAVSGRGDTGLLPTGHRWLEMGSAGHVGDLVSHDISFCGDCSELLQTLEPCSYS